jgi:hypothetical protein
LPVVLPEHGPHSEHRLAIRLEQIVRPAGIVNEQLGPGLTDLPKEGGVVLDVAVEPVLVVGGNPEQPPAPEVGQHPLVVGPVRLVAAVLTAAVLVDLDDRPERQPRAAGSLLIRLRDVGVTLRLI